MKAHLLSKNRKRSRESRASNNSMSRMISKAQSMQTSFSKNSILKVHRQSKINLLYMTTNSFPRHNATAKSFQGACYLTFTTPLINNSIKASCPYFTTIQLLRLTYERVPNHIRQPQEELLARHLKYNHNNRLPT